MMADRAQRKPLCVLGGGELAQVECAGLAGQAAVSSEDKQLGIMKVGSSLAAAPRSRLPGPVEYR
jgi:hypothetical protein